MLPAVRRAGATSRRSSSRATTPARSADHRRRSAWVLTTAAAFVATSFTLQPAAAAAAETDPATAWTASGNAADEGASPAVAATGPVRDAAPDATPLTQDQLLERARARALEGHQYTFRDADDLEAAATEEPATSASGNPAEPGGPEAGGMAAAAVGVDLPTAPLAGDLQDCLSAPGAETQLGRVHNRFLFCRKADLETEYWEVDNKGVPVEKAGTSTIDYSLIAYGSKQGRAIRVFLRTEEDSAEYDWGDPIDNNFTAPGMHLSLDVQCGTLEISDLRCAVDPTPVVRTWSEWDEGSEWISFTVVAGKPETSENPEFSLLHEWFVTHQGSDEDQYKVITRGKSASRTLRCDSGTYFRNQGDACVFFDVIPHLRYSTVSLKQKEVAEHIREAQDNPDSTYPKVSPERPKRIPGKFTGDADDPPLHRLPNSDPQTKLNTSHKNGACKATGQYVGLGLPPALRPGTGQDCDEYPFRSTVEGAANPDWDFSVKAVNRGQNRSAGSTLGHYFDGDRIFHYRDPFYVAITDDGEPGDPPGNAVVSAGPDVTGTEGTEIFLDGEGDAAEEESLRWSVRPLDGVDAGATCTFTDEYATDTWITCTDDGTFEVTLTSDDGSDEAVSDTALVTVANAAPVLRLEGPREWQLFRVGTPVDLDAPFTDAGDDSHRCTVTWDDGSSSEYAATSSTCDTSHTFTRAGMFTMSVTVTDDDGASDSADRMIVVYDPQAGFTNADGSLNAPAGSLSGSGSAAQGWFHLTGRYYSAGATTPVGTARAWVDGSTFRFDAPGDSSMDWLVVTPDGKTAALARGTVGGVPSGVVFYGYDGCDNGGVAGCRPGPDRFRTVVWEGGAGSYPAELPRYDTNRGSSYDLDQAQPSELRSGRVTIQR
ncbi:PKD domain-containing protein [Cellulomonas wangsupingiae]|uniref:PKD domain-containing protein n=1 Tax=Cellulomonas wangsupingiae TaxID=2968085 RepID=A0ABY5K703_9CELL|nr:PKD domain-containing protein [Cellulomonas wangsupingiae]MCC2335079.1 PKD domain-containing protein [Cellulomonas wangsupingiae]MCM0638951.1 PKD domain-containing protein [Cellulomonas wangsupingiae]UUI65574.1 PKD domain-containing protein [Cellulomonas wangsupingiae]